MKGNKNIKTMEMQEKAMHEAEEFLRNPENPSSLHVRIGGRRRRLFINRGDGRIGIVAIGKRKRGYVFNEWNTIEKVFYETETDRAELERKRVLKYQKLAKSASFSNSWLRDIAKADTTKSLYENRITTGNDLDGKCIRLATIGKHCGSREVQLFREAVRKREIYHSPRFDFCGYDGTLWCEPKDNGDIMAGFSKEFRNCGNGYYYLLINDDTFIGYDID